MRGRVDRSRGVPFFPVNTMQTNLIQQFAHGLGLSRMFSVKERTPSPTVGSEVMPVVVVDDLLKSAWPPRPQVFGGTALGPGAPGVNNRWFAIFGGDNTVETANARLVVHEFWYTQNVTANQQISMYIGQGLPIAGLTTNFCHYSDPGYDQQVGIRQSNFSVFAFGESPLAPPVTGLLFQVPQNVVFHVKGPWILGFNEVLAIQHGATAGPSSCWFKAEEWPRA